MIDLAEIAHKAMIDRGFIPDFPKPVLDELERIQAPAKPLPKIRDMREWLWVSIDNDDSRDLDQLTFAEKDKIYVAVADVDALVKKGSAIDVQARHNTTSVYTPTEIFLMLPSKLCYDLTSLNEKMDRLAIVVEMNVTMNGQFELEAIYPAFVRNQAKLTYNGVGACLEQGSCQDLPRGQLELQDQIAQRIQAYRDQEGALVFAERELHAVIVNGIPVGLAEKTINRAHKLIENFMIAANVGVTRYLIEKKLPSIRRVVKTPKRWDRIVSLAKGLGDQLPVKPDARALRKFLLHQQKVNPSHFSHLSLAVIKLIGRGEYVLGKAGEKHLEHFNLAEVEYAHTTAPNRRYPDIIMQRILKSSLQGLPLPYSNGELTEMAAHCTQKEDDANKVERQLIKCAAAMILVKEIGKTFHAMVTGASPKGTWVRLLDPPVEGKLVKGFKGVDVGDYLTVRLERVDVMNGHIDFSRI
ncbi:MAG TPA: RNB domain-containing ribonuclease [Chlamydiales bacterium]|nr:RNB domain-containing ribonuclease [Chlamydiales bacterium]